MLLNTIAQWAMIGPRAVYRLGAIAANFSIGAYEKASTYLFPKSPQPFNAAVGGDEHIHPRIRIIYINGVLNSPDDCEESAKKISQVFHNTVVYYTCIPTAGTLRDVVGAVRTLITPKKNIASQTVLQNIKDRLHELREHKDATICILAHSAGALAIEQAHKELTAAECSKIQLFTFGTAIALPQNMFKKVRNYASQYDPIPAIGRITRGYLLRHPGVIKTIESEKRIGIFEAHYFLGQHYQNVLPKIRERLLREKLNAPSDKCSRCFVLLTCFAKP